MRWGAPPVLFKSITSVSNGAPAVVVAANHGLPDGWRVAFVSLKGMTQLNATNDPPKAKEHYSITVIDTNSFEVNGLNTADYKAHTAGSGYVRTNTPVSLAGYVARMKIKDKVGGVTLASTEVEDAPANIITAVVDDSGKTITITINASDTAALTWSKGVYDLEMVSSDVVPVVTELLSGSVSVSKEITA